MAQYEIAVTKPYLWFPVRIAAQKQYVEIFANGAKCFEFDIPVKNDDNAPDFYGCLEVAPFIGQTFLLQAPVDESWFAQIRQEDSRPDRPASPNRPLLHMTANSGWINDPNGLVYHDGTYHLFFQHNPFDVAWGNMSWGHCVSKDLMHWTQIDTALHPDSSGTMFSGSGLVDVQNALGYGQNTLAFFYTAAGGSNPWSKGTLFTQHLAVSTDEGRTLQKQGVAVPTIGPDSRDPKVFWHEVSQAYIMALWIEGNDYAILRSTDLRHWEQSQRFTMPDAWECPDLFCLPVYDAAGAAHGEKWVFWSAPGYYSVGNFDGYRYTPEESHSAYARDGVQKDELSYAAQTYSNTPGRVINIAWLRPQNRGELFTGCMGIPREFSLIKTASGTILQHKPAKEFTDLLRADISFGLAANDSRCCNAAEEPFVLDLSLQSSAACKAEIEYNGFIISVNLGDGTVCANGRTFAFDKGAVCGAMDLQLIVDYKVVELTAANHTLYTVMENTSHQLAGNITVRTEDCAATAGLSRVAL